VDSFDAFLSHLDMIRDARRAEGRLYQLRYILLFSILAIVTGANSYRGIRTFIKVHLKRLNKAFNLGWKRPPAHTAIRYILQGLDPADVEKVFREHAADLNGSEAAAGTLFTPKMPATASHRNFSRSPYISPTTLPFAEPD
jgi:DDE_Tnp_1-associated